MNEILLKAREHYNDPVLVYHNLARVIGYAESDEEPLLVVKHINGNVGYHPDLSGLIFLDSLKGKNKKIDTSGYVWDDYKRLDSLLNAMNCNPQDMPINGLFQEGM